MIDINNYIDHTLLRPTATTDEIKKLCEEAIANQFKAVCVAPIHIDTAKQSIEKNNVNLCSVVGFPFGYNHIGTKLDEIARAIDSGADELDVVINIGAIKNEDWKKVESEMDSIATATKLKKSKILKFILETAYLTDKELKLLCQLCVKYNVDFAKTSTGYAPQGANIDVVKKMKAFLGGKVAIKASGGIKDRKFAEELINAGATRLGTSAGLVLIN